MIIVILFLIGEKVGKLLSGKEVLIIKQQSFILQDIGKTVFSVLKDYFDSLIINKEESMFLFDYELDGKASCCTTGQVACFYLLDSLLNNNSNIEIVFKLIEDLNTQQLASGGFPQPYYAKKGEKPLVDIAEIGAVASSLFYIAKFTSDQNSYNILEKASNYLITQISKENEGAVYKNPSATEHDVLNGDIYAAHTWGRFYQLSNKKIYLKKAKKVLNHVMNRFAEHESGWWPYIENWDGTIGMGNSIAYQGTIVSFADTLLPYLENEQRQRWLKIREEAVNKILKELKEGPNSYNEVPWWARDWDNTWEIYLALWRHRKSKEAKETVIERLIDVKINLLSSGIEIFKPKVKSNSKEERNPVTTTFRKAATFAGIFSYIILATMNSEEDI